MRESSQPNAGCLSLRCLIRRGALFSPPNQIEVVLLVEVGDVVEAVGDQLVALDEFPHTGANVIGEVVAVAGCRKLLARVDVDVISGLGLGAHAMRRQVVD